MEIPEDYDHQLTKWFQTPEIRSEIRAYLRHRLFMSIQNSPLGPRLARKDIQPVSPKLQTLNLLVAEYLLRHQHQFTLSVFSCEVPSVSCLTPSLQDTLNCRTSSAVPFKPQDLQDMLETLGVSPKSPEGIELTKNYRQQDQPLLVCLIRALPELRSPVSATVPDRRDKSCNTDDDCRSDVAAVATAEHETAIADLERQHKEKLIEINEKCDARCAALEKLEEEKISRNHEEHQNLVTTIENLKSQILKAEEALVEITKEKKNSDQKMLEKKKEEEFTIEVKHQELSMRQSSLEKEAQRLEREKASLKKTKKKLVAHQKHLDEISLALVHSHADAAEASKPNLQPILEMELAAKDSEISELKSAVSNLQEENRSLRSVTEHQRHRIESLNLKITELVSEVQMAKESVASASLPQWTSHYSRRQSSSSNDSSPTDDIVRDARRRIRTLEEEFEAIGQYHRDFQARHQGESLLSSVLGTSRQIYSSLQNERILPYLRATSPKVLAYQNQTSGVAVPDPPPIPKLPKSHSPRRETSETVTENIPQKTQPKNKLEISQRKITSSTKDEREKPNDHNLTKGPSAMGDVPTRAIPPLHPMVVSPIFGLPAGSPSPPADTNDRATPPLHPKVESPVFGLPAASPSPPADTNDLRLSPVLSDEPPKEDLLPASALPTTDLLLAQPTRLVKPTSRSEESRESSSSDLHISAGPKDDEDDFWNM